MEPFHDEKRAYREISLEQTAKCPLWYAFNINDPSLITEDLWAGIEIPDFREDRSNHLLVQVVEELGRHANGEYAELKIVDVPDDVEWFIDGHDGCEWVAEKHRIWR